MGMWANVILMWHYISVPLGVFSSIITSKLIWIGIQINTNLDK